MTQFSGVINLIAQGSGDCSLCNDDLDNVATKTLSQQGDGLFIRHLCNFGKRFKFVEELISALPFLSIFHQSDPSFSLLHYIPKVLLHDSKQGNP